MLKLGVINYINSIPLGEGAERYFDVYKNSPAKNCDSFLNGELDLAFIPSVEFIRHRDRCVPVADLCIASRGETKSVLVCSHNDFHAVRTLRLDSDSRTSNFLAQYILRSRYGCQIEVVDEDADAFVIIGDDALSLEVAGYNVLDIGNEWFALTGLPVVYSVCVASDRTVAVSSADILCALRDSNLRNLPQIAEAVGITEQLDYLNCLDYKLSRRHRDSLKMMAEIVRGQ